MRCSIIARFTFDGCVCEVIRIGLPPMLVSFLATSESKFVVGATKTKFEFGVCRMKFKAADVLPAAQGAET